MTRGLSPGRHDRGWPKVTLLTWTTRSDQSFRFHVQAMGRRDSWDARGGWMEIVEFLRMGHAAQGEILDGVGHHWSPLVTVGHRSE